MSRDIVEARVQSQVFKKKSLHTSQLPWAAADAAGKGVLGYPSLAGRRKVGARVLGPPDFGSRDSLGTALHRRSVSTCVLRFDGVLLISPIFTGFFPKRLHMR